MGPKHENLNTLSKPVVADTVRFYPKAGSSHAIMQVELFAVPYELTAYDRETAGSYSPSSICTNYSIINNINLSHYIDMVLNNIIFNCNTFHSDGAERNQLFSKWVGE